MKFLKHYLRTVFIFAPKLAFGLSDKFPSAIWLVTKLWVFLISNKLFGSEMSFVFRFMGKDFHLRLKSGIDVAVLTEVFVLREYDWELDFEPQTIVDLGAHWGDSSLYYAMRYPDAKVFAVEPAPNMFDRLKEVVAQFENVVPVNAAVGDKTGEIEFYVSENSLGNSVQKRNKTDKRILVQSYGLEDFMKAHEIEKIDLLKFDIEGAEEKLFQAKGIKRAKACIGELHFDLINLSKDDVVQLFADTYDISLEPIDSNRSIMKAIKHGT